MRPQCHHCPVHSAAELRRGWLCGDSFPALLRVPQNKGAKQCRPSGQGAELPACFRRKISHIPIGIAVLCHAVDETLRGKPGDCSGQGTEACSSPRLVEKHSSSVIEVQFVVLQIRGSHAVQSCETYSVTVHTTVMYCSCRQHAFYLSCGHFALLRLCSRVQEKNVRNVKLETVQHCLYLRLLLWQNVVVCCAVQAVLARQPIETECTEVNRGSIGHLKFSCEGDVFQKPAKYARLKQRQENSRLTDEDLSTSSGHLPSVD